MSIRTRSARAAVAREAFAPAGPAARLDAAGLRAFGYAFTYYFGWFTIH